MASGPRLHDPTDHRQFRPARSAHERLRQGWRRLRWRAAVAGCGRRWRLAAGGGGRRLAVAGLAAAAGGGGWRWWLRRWPGGVGWRRPVRAAAVAGRGGGLRRDAAAGGGRWGLRRAVVGVLEAARALPFAVARNKPHVTPQVTGRNRLLHPE
nr:hypothetical protein GCM10017745_76800 [Saccharothrix mutabilis subsp. capreolus]